MTDDLFPPELHLPAPLVRGLERVAERHDHCFQYELEEAIVFYLNVIDDLDSDAPHYTIEQRDHGAAVLGSRGGKKGGPARAAKLSPERRREIAQMAARKRWGHDRP